MKTYGRHGRVRTVDLYRVEVALFQLSYVPTKNPNIDNKLYPFCQGKIVLKKVITIPPRTGLCRGIVSELDGCAVCIGGLDQPIEVIVLINIIKYFFIYLPSIKA